MTTNQFSVDEIKTFIAEVSDPEIPVVNVLEMGIVRDIEWLDDTLQVSITPTYSGCPAMQEIENDIVKVLQNKGISKVKVKSILSPPWTTDWLSLAARSKLQAYGIAPPEESTADKSTLFAEPRQIECPQCHSRDTRMISQFGSTACKALHQCNNCQEPFDYFKCI